MQIATAFLPLLVAVTLSLQGSSSVTASPIEDPASPHLWVARQAATNSSSPSSSNTTSSSSADNSSSYDPTAALASLPKVVSTFDANSSSTGYYSSLNDTYLPAINATSQGFQPEHSVSGSNGAVTTEIDICSNVGADLLAKGGSAADAIIGAALCVGTIDTFHSNIGGGGYALTRFVSNSSNSTDRKSAQYEMIDFRETMPALGNETLYSNNSDPTASTIGGLAVGVPGELRGWEMLHQKHGKLPWADIFQPAIDIAQGGFRVPSQLAVTIAQYNESFVCANVYAREVYCPNGTAVGEGEIIRKPRYAKTLQTIAQEGANAFYTGSIATNTIAAIQSNGGIMTLGDLANYTAIARTPNNISWGENGKYNVFSTVAPSSGNVVLSTLKVMDIYRQNGTLDDYNLTLHRTIEATKFAYGERAYLGDPGFINNVTSFQEKVITTNVATEKRNQINDSGVLPLTAYDPSNYGVLSDNGTSQLTVIDKDGNAVSLTTTVNTLWGSQVMTADGILLNNEMDDFSSPGQSANSFGYVPAAANFIRPGKRPLSSISPVMAEDAATGEIVFAVGSAGGSRIITANIINSFNLLKSDGQINIQQSLAMPRWHDQLQPQTTVLEWAASYPVIPNWKGFDNSTAAYLANLGHNITYTTPGSSTANGIQRFSNGTILGGAEVRQLSARAAAI